MSEKFQAKEKVINDRTYRVSPFTGRIGTKFLSEVTEAINPALDIIKKSIGDKSIDLKELLTQSAEKKTDENDDQLQDAMTNAGAILGIDSAKMVSVLLKEFTKDELFVRLFSATRIDGREVTESNFDSFFNGNYSELFSALVFIVSVNFKDLFTELLTILAQFISIK